MTESTNNTNPKPPRFREAFERLTCEIQAVENDDLVPINLDVPSVVATVLGVSAKIRGFHDDIVKHLPSFDIDRFDRLESYALALGHAQTEYQTATEPPASLVELAAKVSRIRGILLSDINTLVARELLPESVLKDVKGGTGHKNFAFDVFALSNLYKHHWDKISPYTAIKREELDEAEREADALTTAVGEREQSPAVLAQVVRDRQAAFTLLVILYDEIRTAFAYLRRRQGDADSIAPSLYAGRAVAKKKPTEDDHDNPPSPATTPSTGNSPAATGTQVSPSQPTKSAAAGPFMQG
jgi:hypothetical protein